MAQTAHGKTATISPTKETKEKESNTGHHRVQGVVKDGQTEVMHETAAVILTHCVIKTG